MLNPFGDFEAKNSIWDKLFLDKVFTMVIGLFAMVLIMIMFINDPGKEEANDITPPGQVIFEIYWDDDANVDIDGWVQGPRDVGAVGYKNRAGIQFNLLRDDRGHNGDISGENYENFFSRGVAEGTYMFNVHWFGGNFDTLEIKVIVSVMTGGEAGDKSGNAKQILAAKVKLSKWEDKNVIIFELDKEGNLIRGSLRDDQTINLKGQYGVPDRTGTGYGTDYEDGFGGYQDESGPPSRSRGR